MTKNTETITAEELCTLSGLTDRRHRQLAKSGYFPNPENGLYEWEPTIRGLIKWLREQADRQRGRGALDKAKTTLITAKAKEVKSEAARLRGDTVPTTDAKRCVRLIGASITSAVGEVSEEIAAKFAPGELVDVKVALRNALMSALRSTSATIFAGYKFEEWILKAWHGGLFSGLLRDDPESFAKDIALWREIIAECAGQNYENTLAELRARRQKVATTTPTPAPAAPEAQP